MGTNRWGVTLVPMNLSAGAMSIYLGRAKAATCAMGKAMGVVYSKGNVSRHMNNLAMSMGHTGSMHIMDTEVPVCRLRNRIQRVTQRSRARAQRSPPTSVWHRRGEGSSLR